MPDPLYRLEYDATADDIVDVAFRMSNRSQAFRKQVRLTIWTAGTLAALLCLASWLYFSNERPGFATDWIILIGGCAAFGACFSYVFRKEFHKQVRKQHRRVIVEQMGGQPTMPCELELRNMGIWVRQQGLEMTFPWSQSTGIEDTGNELELWFKPLSLVVVRNRRFSSPAERQRFLEQARALAAR